MRPLVRLATLVAALAAVTQVAAWVHRGIGARPPSTRGPSPALSLEAPCGPGTLPDGHACVPVPSAIDPVDELTGGDTPPQGFFPLQPHRPQDLLAYTWPVPVSEGDPGSIRIVPPVAVWLDAAPATPVRAIRLAGQVGDAEVLALAEVQRHTLVALHTRRTPTGLRSSLVFYGNLAETTPGLHAGSPLPDGLVLGTVGASASGEAGLHFEVRHVRRGVDPTEILAADLRHPAQTIACDPRNVLAPKRRQ